MSACVQVPPVESAADGSDIPVHEQLVNDLTAVAADSLGLMNAIRREYTAVLTAPLRLIPLVFVVHVP